MIYNIEITEINSGLIVFKKTYTNINLCETPKKYKDDTIYNVFIGIDEAA